MHILAYYTVGHSSIGTYYATPSLPVKFRKTVFGKGRLSHDTCAVTISPPAPHSTSSFVVLAALYQKKVIAQHDLQKWKGSAWNMLSNLIFDLCTRPTEDVATTADVLDMVGWKKEAEMLRGKLCLC